MITRKFLLAALTLFAIIFTPSCKDDDMEYVSMNVETKNISVGEEYQFFVTVSSTTNSTYSGSVKWSVSDASIASIDQNGKVVGKKESTEGVLVKATLDNGRYAIAYLYVGSRTISSSDSVTVARKLLYMNSADIDTVKVWVANTYSDGNKYPLSAVMSKMNEDGTIVEYDENDPSTWAGTTVEIYTLEDYESMFGTSVPPASGDEEEGEGEGEETTTASSGKTYVLRFIASNVDELAACSVTVGDLTQTIQMHVDFALYLSYNTIDPNRLDPKEISSEKPLDIKVNGSGNMQFNFYVVDDDNLTASQALVESTITNLSNYSVTGSLSVILGTPQVSQNSNGSYMLTVPVSAGQVSGSGTIKLTAFGKTITSKLTVDDGKTYKAVYISFATPNTYTIPPTEMVLTTSLQAFKSEENSTPNTLTIRVYHYVDPDTSAPYINWEQNQSGDPVIIPMGSQCDSQNKFTDFEYQVGTSTGVATVTFNVYNPQGEQGGEFSEWLNQSITATITIMDKADVEVNSVTFNPDILSTLSATVPLEAVLEPATSSSTWPIDYSVASVENGAEATITSSEDENGNLAYSLNITKAGVIKVKAEAGPDGNKKSDELTVTAKLQLDVVNYSEPLQIINCPSSMKVGETASVTKLLRANYSVNEDQYKWVSSDEDVVTVDGLGNLEAVGPGTATIRVEIKDDFNIYASATRTITVSSLDINANFDTLDDYFVISEGGLEFWVDMEEEGASGGIYYTFNLDKDILSSDGVYTAGTDFTGTVKFPDGTTCDITGGTITVSSGSVTFDLTVSYGASTGTITGTRPLRWL